MTKRVYLSSSNLRVSLPGNDAVTGSDSGMAFDASVSGYVGVFFAGTLPFGSFATIDATQLWYEGTLSFGRTFSAPPFVIWTPILSGQVKTAIPGGAVTYCKITASSVVFGIIGGVNMDVAYRICQQ